MQELDAKSKLLSSVSYLSLLSSDAVDGETSLHIVDQTEVLTGLLNADHIWINTK